MAKKLQFVSEAVIKAQAKLQIQKKALINLPPTKQAIIHRALIVKSNKLRQKAIQDSKNRSDELRRFKDSQSEKSRLYSSILRNERKNRREDWLLGPLAPMRDSGIERYTYGATSTSAIQEPALLKEDKTKHIPFVKGDRVVVVSGRQKGKIAKIERVDEEAGCAALEEIEEYDIALPKWSQVMQDTTEKIMTDKALIPIQALRLVVPLPDPDTDVLRDVVVKSMEVFFPDSHENYVLAPERYVEDTHPVTGKEVQRYVRPKRTNELTEAARRKFEALPKDGEPYYGNYYSTLPKFARFIEGLDIAIPWPEAKPVTYVDNDVDTLRIEAETVTFDPSLKEMPMPPSVLDELRNRFSRTRTRHEDGYIQKKDREAAREEWRENTTLATPLELFKRARIEMKHERDQKPATEGQKNLLAKMIAKSRDIGTTYDMVKDVKGKEMAKAAGGAARREAKAIAARQRAREGKSGRREESHYAEVGRRTKAARAIMGA